MVFFTCNHCGESLKKAAVEKHYQWKSCRNAPFANLTCVDCLQDFHADAYKEHTKCVSEAERYAAKGQYVAKPDKNKGAQKQEIWTECLEELASRADIDKTLRDVLQRIAAQSNVPRKKPKFINFLKSSMRFNVHRSEQVWKVIEEGLEEFKNRAAPPPRPTASADTAETSESAQTNGVATPSGEDVAKTEQTNGSAHVNGNASGDGAMSEKQIAEVLSYALLQPDTDKATRKILKKLQKCPDVPLSTQNPTKGRKKFTAFVQSRFDVDAEMAKQVWHIVSSASSVIVADDAVTVTNGVAATNGKDGKRKATEDDDNSSNGSVPSKKSKPANGNAVEATNGDAAAADFDWQKNILRIFNKTNVENAIELATLQTKVIKRYARHIGRSDDDGAAAAAATQHAKKVKKHLKKIDSLIIESGVVKLKA